MTSLNHDFAISSNWIYKNFFVLNLDKYYFMLFGVNDDILTDLASNNSTVKDSKKEKILGIIFDNKLDFSLHLTSITKKTNIKLNNLTRVQKYIILEQKAFLTSSFLKSKFNYCPLIWMFCL